ncbi:MAG: hypothetical protein ACKKL4_03065 [Patescibacteria group bacterium]
MAIATQISQDIRKHLARLTAGEEEQLLDMVGEVLWQRVAIRAASYLSEASQEKLRSLIDTQEIDSKKLVSFLAQDIPHLAEIVGEEAYNLREEYYAIMKASE